MLNRGSAVTRAHYRAGLAARCEGDEIVGESMRIFHCDHCEQLVFFESTTCVSCGRQLAYLPDVGTVGSLDTTADGTFRSPLPEAGNQNYRLCRNFVDVQVCNWALPVSDPEEFCVSCRLTNVIPDISRPGARDAWYRLEVAKRRLVFTLLALKLPISDRVEDPAGGLAFHFK